MSIAFFNVIYSHYDVAHILPVVEEKPAISKQSVLRNTVMEERGVTKIENFA
jgi:hypothetical protein